MPRGFKKTTPEEMNKLVDEFEKIIVPWCRENKLGYYSTKMLCQNDPQKKIIFNAFMKTEIGRAFISSYFEDNKQFGEKRKFENYNRLRKDEHGPIELTATDQDEKKD